MGRVCLIAVLGLAVSASFLMMGAHEKGSSAVLNSSNSFTDTGAGNLAHSAANLALKNITADPSWTTTGESRNLSDGPCYFSCDRVPASVNSMIQASGTYSQSSHGVRVLVQTRAPNLRSAITANPPVDTLGTFIVDGRDYDETGNIIPGQGGLAVECSNDVTRRGSSVYGGTNANGDDFAPTTTYDPSIVKDNSTFDGGFPDNPDAVIGVPVGTLKTRAMSGVSGSQYTTDPSTLSMPLSGVTYVDLPSGGQWNDATLSGSGILVVHSPTKDAIIKNMYGTFKGIIIADDVDKIHGTIIGNLTVPGDVATGNCIGNGEGQVLFSSYQIFQVLKDLNNPDLKIISWWE
ncbi:MAG: hypothetical protein JW941_09080 [Candidatus Coatesbacteria bacterium]|nr:hypothetical protein [Candidatus Coatesbacteria bacterium]